jgi:hypothetical protein
MLAGGGKLAHSEFTVSGQRYDPENGIFDIAAHKLGLKLTTEFRQGFRNRFRRECFL